MNLCADRLIAATLLAKIRHVFGEFVTLPVRRDGNLIVFAFKKDLLEIPWQQLESNAIQLRQQLGLDFPRFVERIALDWKLRGGQSLPV